MRFINSNALYTQTLLGGNTGLCLVVIDTVAVKVM